MSKPRPISFITTFLDSSGSSPAEKGATTASLHDAECMSAMMSLQAHVEPFAFTGIENSGIPKLKKKVSSHAYHLHDASLRQVSPVSSVKAPYQQILLHICQNKNQVLQHIHYLLFYCCRRHSLVNPATLAHRAHKLSQNARPRVLLRRTSQPPAHPTLILAGCYPWCNSSVLLLLK